MDEQSFLQTILYTICISYTRTCTIYGMLTVPIGLLAALSQTDSVVGFSFSRKMIHNMMANVSVQTPSSVQ